MSSWEPLRLFLGMCGVRRRDWGQRIPRVSGAQVQRSGVDLGGCRSVEVRRPPCIYGRS